jgi:hypothetical protein
MLEMITDEELIDEASQESFPASDPPSWTMGTARDRDPSAARGRSDVGKDPQLERAEDRAESHERDRRDDRREDRHEDRNDTGTKAEA